MTRWKKKVNKKLPVNKLYEEALDAVFTKADRVAIKRQQKEMLDIFDEFLKKCFQAVHIDAIEYVQRDIGKVDSLEDLLHQVYSQLFLQLREMIIDAAQVKLIPDSFIHGVALAQLVGTGGSIPEDDTSTITTGGKA